MGEGDKPTREDRPFWALSPEDQHTMWVSFVGGIAQGIVLAIIIGGAIALARATRHTPLWLPIAVSVVGLLLLIQPARRYSTFRHRQGIYAKEKARRAYVAIV